MEPLGLIAGGGDLPVEIAETLRSGLRPLFVVRLKGMADAALNGFEGADVGLAELGRCFKALRGAGCRRICFAGQTGRPDLATLKPDLTALKYLPGVAAAAKSGDDALLRAVLNVFEKEGFEVEGVGEAGRDLLIGSGALGARSPTPAQMADIDAAMAAALEVGRTDRGQGAIVRDGEVLAEEGYDGTDAMLARAADDGLARGGVLAKRPKPGQEIRVDLPTIGPETLERAAAAGLVGVAGPADALMVVRKHAVRAAADRLGLFVWGAQP